nr:unnamed protein product [Callosobruchus chinensis]
MAKWGEGDPRWIVEERPDATNVNNWHWTEKNASPWSQDRIRELFKDIAVKTDAADLKIVEVESMEGEASANNRKGKLIFFYEWDLVLKWKGSLTGSDKQYSGKIKIPNLSEENDVSELDIQIAVETDDEASSKLKQIMMKDGKELVRSQLSKYIAGLKEEFSKGMILPKKGEVKPDSIKQTQKFQCTAEEFYDALTRLELVTAFTRGDVQLDLSKGGKFSLFGGNIIGLFDELVPAKKIVQQWRYKQWPEGHYSVVTININQKDDHTEVSLEQAGVPKSEIDVTKENWQRYYWDAIKQTFGFGAFFT